MRHSRNRALDGDSENLEEQNEDLKEQNDELEKENEELKEELNEYEEDLEDEEDEVDEDEEEIAELSYDDDAYYDGYWSELDWDSVWGDSSASCYKLNDANRQKAKFNPNVKPGNDAWPYLNIYGNCKSCEAYIVDIYSTEHFQHVQTFKVASFGYGIAALVSLLVTIFVSVRRRYLKPKHGFIAEKGDSFLSSYSHDRGTLA